MDLARAERFIRENTAPAPVPLVPEISLYLASELTPLWHATEATLAAWDNSPFWAFAWAGGQALARYVLDHPELVRGRRVLDFGAGSALVAIAAARAGAVHVRACDIDPFFVAAARLNAGLNRVEIETVTESVLGVRPEKLDADVIVAGDVFYERDLARDGLAWFRALTRAGRLVLVGDPGRIYSPAEGLAPCATYDVPTTTEIEVHPVRETRVLRVV
jgi:predicted nicotinamide N-methyase